MTVKIFVKIVGLALLEYVLPCTNSILSHNTILQSAVGTTKVFFLGG